MHCPVPVLGQRCPLADSHACDRASQASPCPEAEGSFGGQWRCRCTSKGAARGRTAGWSRGRGGCKSCGRTVIGTLPRVPRPGRMRTSDRVSACWLSPAPLAVTCWQRRTGRCTTQPVKAWARLGWEQVDRVDWDEGRQVLILTGLTPAVPVRTVLHLAKAWDLPAVAAERVSWAKVFDQRISLTGVAGARVVARRIPGEAH